MGDEVLLLQPTSNNKLLMQWKGPFKVIKKQSNFDYTIDMLDNQKTFHINMLMKYHRPGYAGQESAVTTKYVQVAELLLTVSVPGTEEPLSLDETDWTIKKDIGLPPIEPKETTANVSINPELPQAFNAKVKCLINQYANVFTDVPGRTNLGEHDIMLSDNQPVRKQPYPAPHSLRLEIQEEVDEMITMGVVETSDSPYASPLVIVKKPDGTKRYCVDYRALNAKTVFDAEPIPDITEIFANLASDHYFTKIDLTKGYWQIPMKAEAKPLAAFITNHGLFIPV